ncbi:MAG: hypothetical protein AMS24_02330 [Chlamydiae bacterium SM23_39]|nr:MAG: hypothetical protein AMS24_02330 [Chlamydiae bacterium SM23_39]
MQPSLNFYNSSLFNACLKALSIKKIIDKRVSKKSVKEAISRINPEEEFSLSPPSIGNKNFHSLISNTGLYLLITATTVLAANIILGFKEEKENSEIYKKEENRKYLDL